MNLSIEQQSGHIEPSTVTISNMDASYSDFEQEVSEY